METSNSLNIYFLIKDLQKWRAMKDHENQEKGLDIIIERLGQEGNIWKSRRDEEIDKREYEEILAKKVKKG